MDAKRPSGKGIRGWSVLQRRGPLQTARAREERNWREILEASRGRLLRGVLIAVACWGALSFTLGERGLMQLQALKAEEGRLTSENEALAKEHTQVLFELDEDPGLSMERVLREQYRKSLKNEIILQAVPAAAPADTGDGWPAREDGSDGTPRSRMP
jgi:cell division protein FtsB